MPGVARGEMNNGYRDFEHGHLRSSSYANGYDPYRRDDYRDGPKRHNGVDELEGNSFDMKEGRDPTFEVDHLATYTSKTGTTHPEDGLTKLKQMESSTGIWTMRCMMIVERRNIIVIDKGNGDELERFPLTHIHEPTAVLKNDRRETYNNLILFTILEDPRRKNTGSDMHIFQSVNAPAHDIVDEILAAKGDGGRRGPLSESRRDIPPPPSGPAPEPPYASGKFSNYRETHAPASFGVEPPLESRLQETRLDDNRYADTGRFTDGRGFGASRVDNFRASYFPRDDMDTGQNEALERDVQLLNSCFDDIEKFVSRLQQAAEAYKELERRRGERGGKKNKKQYSGDGMLQMRARPPPADDFVDIFQKFKFAFNLLAKLKAHIHDPNAPELVHFLFTPLSLIYEASRDPIHGGRDLGNEAVSPLLLYDAKQLLVNCLTTKELELWQRLGRPWTMLKEEWHGYVPPYNPRFYSGWQPSTQLVDEVNHTGRDGPLRTSERVPYMNSSRREEPYRATRRDDYAVRETHREDPYSRGGGRDGDRNDFRADYTDRNNFRHNDDDYRRPPSPPAERSPPFESKRSTARDPIPAAPKSRSEENAAFAQDLKRMGATEIYEALHERQGKNQKELNVEKGDILQVLDKSRNWWKLKNYMGETGYAPYTILKEYQARDDYDHNHSSGGNGRLSGDYSSYINGGAPPPPPPPMAGSARAGSRTGDSESHQQAPPSERPVAPPTPEQRQIRHVATPREDARRRHGEKSMYTPDLHHELRDRINTSGEQPFSGVIDSPRGRHPSDERSYRGGSSPRSPRSPNMSPRSPKVANLSQYSNTEETREWLESKGFTRRCMGLLHGYNGLDLFTLDKRELERLLGKEEGRHLDSLLTVQKNTSGYRTRGASELRAILQRRKERSDNMDRDEDNFGARPSFMPETPPDYSPADSDASSDDFGDAGKTLRNLLERQRKKIQQGGYRDRGPYQ